MPDYIDNTDQNPQNGPKISLEDLYGPSQPPPPEVRYEEIPPDPSFTTAPPPVNSANESNTPVPENVSPMGLETEFKKEKKKKRLLIIGGVIAFLLVLGIGLWAAFFSPRKESVGEATLTYWGLWEDPKIIQTIINDFQREYPSIKITYKKQDPKQYKDRLLARANNNAGADIFTFHNSWTPTLLSILSPFPIDVIQPEEFKKQYFPVIQNDLVNNGAIYGLPQGIDTLALFINKELFDAAGVTPPQTWDDFTRVAQTLTVKGKDGTIKTAGAAMGTYDNVTHAPDIISLLLLQNNVKLSDFPNQQAAVAATLGFYSQFTSTTQNVWDSTLTSSRQAFAEGQLAMYFGYSWDTFAIKKANPNLVYELHPVPNIPEKKSAIASYWVTGIAKKSKQQKAAMLFIKYLAKKETYQKLYSESAKTRLFGMPYPRRDLAETLKNEPLVYPFILQAEYAQSTPFSSDTKDDLYSERLNTYLGNAVRGINAGASAESATQTLINGFNQVQSEK